MFYSHLQTLWKKYEYPFHVYCWLIITLKRGYLFLKHSLPFGIIVLSPLFKYLNEIDLHGTVGVTKSYAHSLVLKVESSRICHSQIKQTHIFRIIYLLPLFSNIIVLNNNSFNMLIQLHSKLFQSFIYNFISSFFFFLMIFSEIKFFMFVIMNNLPNCTNTPTKPAIKGLKPAGSSL